MAKEKKKKIIKDTSNMGRPTEYKEEYNIQVKKLCRLGATDKQIADFFNVSETTITTWKGKYANFLLSLKEGKEISDMEVADSLFKRATGYSYNEVKKEVTEDDNGDEKYKKTTTTVKEVIPDTGAAMAWLKNRRPKEWRDRKEIEHSGKMKHEIDYSSLSDEELKNIIANEE